ncbi:glucose-1-phosphate thymidylyltransferase RfbA [Helicobacter sp. MIT 14-3879]|uniref:glucose-1-phosphate thymidylyltransferase RfbA n=1 Tax=Helicobacter sp. MIT 14-3879 TaxID=2040649 RepID=UPI000E1E9133|nr:glucose-1-phosphate thymidylyltransferase RfbA [Helicobacter sp. MIT 14-3879]RDU64781.1 glucose-1-phosphate thymidylyltransferase [Helicobacter sp. MIT 14-3879]
MKGLILAGGSGTRLYPTTQVITKQLLPIYDKPLIMYPLSVLMIAGIREILLIVTKRDIDRFKQLLENGSFLGMKIDYIIQQEPNGLAEAFILGKDFIKNSTSCLILGDNIFYGQGFREILKECSSLDYRGGAVTFAYPVKDPKRFGVVEFDKNYNVLSIEEKPTKPKSNFALTGLYFYDNNVCNIAKNIKPSNRGELEITDINLEYLKNKQLKTKVLGRGFTWLDAGTPESMLEASNFVSIIENKQNYKIACLEEIAYYNGWIDEKALIKRIDKINKSEYGQYLASIIEDKNIHYKKKLK